MLPLFTTLTLILCSVVAVSASPVLNTVPLVVREVGVGSNHSALRTQAIGGLYICSGTNWSGTCGYAVQPLDSCVVLGSDWKNKIASFGPDSCTLCFAYKTNNCAVGDSFFWMFQNPGDASGGQSVPNNAWSGHIASFTCWRSPDCNTS